MYKRYLWKKRIIVVLEDDEKIKSQQKTIFDEVIDELLDRDIIIFGLGKETPPYLKDETMDLATLRDEYSLSSDVNIALIGKDGSVKGKWRNPVTADELFRLIDAMPMRRAEMRKRKVGS